MIAANEAVAREVTARRASMLYRIHETADEEALLRLVPILKTFGIKLPATRGEMTPSALQAALRQAEKLHGGHIVRRLILRALKRAQYSPSNPGHFGLASDCYCHFTSPIRRYPDLVVHRQVKALARGEPPPHGTRDDEDNDLTGLADHCSDRERAAQDAEWEATKIKSLEYMQKFEGEEFDALVSGVQPFGLFVEIEPYPVEGFVSLRDIPGDRWEVDDLGVKIVGRKSGGEIRLGQKVRVQVLRVVPLEQQMDLRLVPDGGTVRTRARRK